MANQKPASSGSRTPHNTDEGGNDDNAVPPTKKTFRTAPLGSARAEPITEAEPKATALQAVQDGLAVRA